MNKKSISSLELLSIITELQVLLRGRISNIYSQDNSEMLLQIHARQKYFLKIVPGKWCCLAAVKNPTLRPSGFAMLLRKYLEHAAIVSITQRNSERICQITLERQEKYHLIIELFSKGNIVLANEEYIVLGALDRHIWKDRTIALKEKYLFPSGALNYFDLTPSEFEKIITHSEKRNLATTLATDIGLGGIYAQELCLFAQVDTNQPPSHISRTDLTSLFESLNRLIVAAKTPRGFIYTDQITPIPLSSQSPLEIKDSFNLALDTLNPHQKISPYEKKIVALRKMIDSQENSIAGLQKSSEINSRKGEMIYENYTLLQQLKDTVEDLRKTKAWSDIGRELEKNPLVIQVNLKDKKITLDL